MSDCARLPSCSYRPQWPRLTRRRRSNLRTQRRKESRAIKKTKRGRYKRIKTITIPSYSAVVSYSSNLSVRKLRLAQVAAESEVSAAKAKLATNQSASSALNKSISATQSELKKEEAQEKKVRFGMSKYLYARLRSQPYPPPRTSTPFRFLEKKKSSPKLKQRLQRHLQMRKRRSRRPMMRRPSH